MLNIPLSGIEGLSLFFFSLPKNRNYYAAEECANSQMISLTHRYILPPTFLVIWIFYLLQTGCHFLIVVFYGA